MYSYAKMVYHYLLNVNLRPTSLLKQNESAVFERCSLNIGVVYYACMHQVLGSTGNFPINIHCIKILDCLEGVFFIGKGTDNPVFINLNLNMIN